VKRRIAILGILVALAGATALWLRPPWQTAGAAPPADRALAPLGLPPDGPLRIVILGTSLSHKGQTWPETLVRRLETCLDRPVELRRLTRPGAGSAWGQGQIGAVAKAAPHLVIVEFAINDADLSDGVSLSAAHRQHTALIAGLRRHLPQARILLMTTSPALGPRGWIRPRLAAHYAAYRTLAEEQDVGLADLYPRWQALPDLRRHLPDGLHPRPETAERVIVPELAEIVAAALGKTCR